jgi:hypothetical protein
MTDLVLASHSPAGGSLGALALLTDEQLDVQIALLRRAQSAVDKVKRSLMVDGVHYGTIPGTNKPSLLKPGAEVLLDAFRLVPDYHVTQETGDGVATPFVSFTVRTTIHVGDATGAVVGVGIGEANSHEKKYRWRQGNKVCLACGKAAIRKSKDEWGGGYYCNGKEGGCGQKFAKGSSDAAQIDSMDTGPVENPDPFDLANTLLKMAAKRSLVSATLAATRSSDLFTQDVDEIMPGMSPKDRAIRVMESLKLMSEQQQTAAKARAASSGVERLTAKGLIDHPAAMASLEEWIALGADAADIEGTAPLVTATDSEPF